MFLIYKDGEIIERAETLRYILRQDNGVAVITTQESHNAVYSPPRTKPTPLESFLWRKRMRRQRFGRKTRP